MTQQPPQPEIDANERDGRYMHATEDVQVDRDIFGNVPKRHRDWSHRRGEPRVMALFWMIYLMGATVVMFAAMSRAHAISYEISRPAARTMLIVVVFGFSLLWPMLRLSQRHPTQGHVWFALRDVFVLFVPLQAILWPQISGILAHWSIPVVAALSLLCASWLLLIGGVLALAMRSISRNDTAAARAIWMLVIVLIVCAAPIVGLLSPAVPDAALNEPRVGWLLSPLTGVAELVRDREVLGVAARVFPQQLRMLAAIGCVGLALLLIARALEVAQRRVRA
ncbi:MAG: hypothetical protein ACX94C_09215 [Phycisphaerales bacterium]